MVDAQVNRGNLEPSARSDQSDASATRHRRQGKASKNSALAFNILEVSTWLTTLCQLLFAACEPYTERDCVVIVKASTHTSTGISVALRSAPHISDDSPTTTMRTAAVLALALSANALVAPSMKVTDDDHRRLASTAAEA